MQSPVPRTENGGFPFQSILVLIRCGHSFDLHNHKQGHTHLNSNAGLWTRVRSRAPDIFIRSLKLHVLLHASIHIFPTKRQINPFHAEPFSKKTLIPNLEHIHSTELVRPAFILQSTFGTQGSMTPLSRDSTSIPYGGHLPTRPFNTLKRQ